MITITDPRIMDYLMKLSPQEDPHVNTMEDLARETEFPIVGRLVGRLLYLLTRLKQPKLVVELGSGFGYSAFWFARALSLSGKVVLIEQNEKHLEKAKDIFTSAGLNHRAEFRLGNVFEIGKQYDNIDILFIDLDKYMYPQAIDMMLPQLNKNALVIADNALWYGRVIEEDADKDNQGIKQFNEFMFGRRDFFTTIVPVRDGVMLAYRLD